MTRSRAGEPSGPDAEWLNEVTSRIGASIGGRWTYEAARHWGDKNPSEMPFFILTHRPEEQPEGDDFRFVAGVEEAVERAGLVDELSIVIAPVILGGGSTCSTASPSRWSWSTRACGQSEYSTTG